MAEKKYIDRGALLAEDFTDRFVDVYDVAIFESIIESAPAADVAPVVHGKWKLHDNGDGTCDQCGFRQKYIWDYDNWQNYCGVCGADMREGKHEKI